VPGSGQRALSDAGFVGRTHVFSVLLKIFGVKAGFEPNGRHGREEDLRCNHERNWQRHWGLRYTLGKASPSLLADMSHAAPSRNSP
jgi:hypothetical protein